MRGDYPTVKRTQAATPAPANSVWQAAGAARKHRAPPIDAMTVVIDDTPMPQPRRRSGMGSAALASLMAVGQVAWLSSKSAAYSFATWLNVNGGKGAVRCTEKGFGVWLEKAPTTKPAP